jgi:rubrerythrin
VLEELTTRKAVEFAVATEELGVIFYTKLANKFSADEEIRDLFSSFAADEKAHGAQFKKLLGQVPPDPKVSNLEERLAFLKIMSRSEFFMGAEGLYRQIDQIETREDALQRSFRLEKDALGYYQAMRDVLGEDEILMAIIAAERRHVFKIMEYLITDDRIREWGYGAS